MKEAKRAMKARGPKKRPARPKKAAAAKPAKAKPARYVLYLYVAGITPRSARAIQSVTNMCEEHLKGRCELKIIDLYQQPTLAKGEQIVAVPTLIKKLPLPLRRLIGNMASAEKLLVGLDLRSENETEKK